MGAKVQIKLAHIRTQGQTFDQVLRAHGTQIDSSQVVTFLRPNLPPLQFTYRGATQYH